MLERNEIIAEIIQDYLADLSERCDELEAATMDLEKAEDKSAGLAKAFRIVHAEQGQAATLGFYTVSNICQLMEESLTFMKPQEANVEWTALSSLLKYVDLLRQAALAYSNRQPTSEIDTALNALHKSLMPTTVRVLIVDSSKVSAALWKSAISDLPVQVTTEKNGYTALSRLLKQEFDAVITSKEVEMLNGVALLAALKAAGVASSNAKTYLISSGSIDDVPAALQQFVDNFVPKDSNAKALLNAHIAKLS
jgi:chemotaxis protein histidine kinase CheA